jgi:hypothetical protein
MQCYKCNYSLTESNNMLQHRMCLQDLEEAEDEGAEAASRCNATNVTTA